MPGMPKVFCLFLEMMRGFTGLSRGAISQLLLLMVLLSGAVYAENENFSSAQARLRCDQLLSLAPHDPARINYSGTLCLQAGRYKEAKAEFQRALERNPRDVHALTGKAWSEFNLQENENALRDAKRAYELQPQSFEANRFMGSVYANLQKPELAISYYVKAARINPDDSLTAEGLGSAYAWLGRHAESAQAYKNAVKNAPPARRAEIANRAEVEAMEAAGTPVENLNVIPGGFTRTAELIINSARKHAQKLGHSNVELVDMLAETAGSADDTEVNAVFDDLDLEPNRVSASLNELPSGRHSGPAGAIISFSTAAGQAMNLALTEADGFLSRYSRCRKASSAHLFLGIIRAADGPLKQLLEREGLTEASVARTIKKRNRNIFLMRLLMGSCGE